MTRRPWDRFEATEYRGDPWESYAAWERWMAAKDDRATEGFGGILDALDIYQQIELYDRMRTVADGDEVPYLRRLLDIITEPWVKTYWRIRWFGDDVRRDTAWYLRSWRSGHRPVSDGDGWYRVVVHDEAGALVRSTTKGMWWDQFPIPITRYGRRRRRAIRAKREAEAATTAVGGAAGRGGERGGAG
jgi:hypothetical protein